MAGQPLVSVAKTVTDLGVSGAGLGVGVERLGLAISSPTREIRKISCDSSLLRTKFYHKPIRGL